MSLIPTISNPLAKSIRTGEGILVYVFNVVLAIAAILPHGLPWTHSVLYATILNGVLVASRTLLKVTAVQKGVGLDPPIPFDPIDPSILEGLKSDQAAAGSGEPDVETEPGTAPSITPTSGKLESARTPDGGDANTDGAAEVAPPPAPVA